MGNKLRTTNLFSYATSELSQDAFICWLLSHVSKDGWDEDSQLRECAISFLNKILKTKKLYFTSNMRAEVKKQYENIDVLVILGDIHIIIEDKTFTNSHDDQVNRYKNILISKGVQAENIFCVFYKIFEQPHPEKDVDFEFNREILLDLFRMYNETSCSENVIFSDYLEYIEYIDKEVNSYKNLKIEDWTSTSYVGFFTGLKNTLLKNEDTSWGYVNNASGGFMGLWWFGIFNDSDYLSMNLTEDVCDEIYLQIEDNIITVKYSLDEKKYKNNECDIEKVQNIRWEIFNYFKSIFGYKFKKKPFKKGQYMTVGYMSYTESDYADVFTTLKEAMINMTKHKF